MADSAKVVSIGQSHDAAAMLPRPLDPQRHRLFTQHLTITALPVQGQHAADVELDGDASVGL